MNRWLCLWNFVLLLFWSIQLRVVHPPPNAEDIYRLPYRLPGFCFSWSSSLGSAMIVTVFLFSSFLDFNFTANFIIVDLVVFQNGQIIEYHFLTKLITNWAAMIGFVHIILLVWWWHQLLSGSLPNGRLSRVSRRLGRKILTLPS